MNSRQARQVCIGDEVYCIKDIFDAEGDVVMVPARTHGLVMSIQKQDHHIVFTISWQVSEESFEAQVQAEQAFFSGRRLR